MKMVAIVLVIGALAFLSKLLFIIYETLCMNFDFEVFWGDDDSEPESVVQQKALTSTEVPWKGEVKEIDGVLLYQE